MSTVLFLCYCRDSSYVWTPIHTIAQCIRSHLCSTSGAEAGLHRPLKNPAMSTCVYICVRLPGGPDMCHAPWDGWSMNPSVAQLRLDLSFRTAMQTTEWTEKNSVSGLGIRLARWPSGPAVCLLGSCVWMQQEAVFPSG